MKDFEFGIAQFCSGPCVLECMCGSLQLHAFGRRLIHALALERIYQPASESGFVTFVTCSFSATLYTYRTSEIT